MNRISGLSNIGWIKKKGSPIQVRRPERARFWAVARAAIMATNLREPRTRESYGPENESERPQKRTFELSWHPHARTCDDIEEGGWQQLS